jgi:hypothetical protein
MGNRPKTVLTGQLNEDDAKAFDAFAALSPFAFCRQSRAWAENAPGGGRHKHLYFLCHEGGDTIGAGVVRVSRLAPGVALATLQGGPLVRETNRLAKVLEALAGTLRDARFSSLVLGPRASEGALNEVAAALAQCGFRPLPDDAQALHVVTGKVSLAGTEEEILGRFKQRGRRAIRKVAAAGVTVRDGIASDLPACAELAEQFHARRPDYDVAGQLGVKAQMRLAAGLGGAFLVAEQDGCIVGYHSFVRQGRDAFWLGLVTDDDPQVPRSYPLLWQAMRRARVLGLEAYDLAGLSADESATGRDQFKQAFAPERVELLPAHVKALRPLRHFLFFNARQAVRAWRRRGK